MVAHGLWCSRVFHGYTHIQLLFAWNPSLLQSSKFSFEYLLLPPRSALGRLHPGSRQRLHGHLRALLYVESSLSTRRPVMGTTLECHPFLGLVVWQVSCYILLGGFRLPWPPSCCLINQHISWNLMSVIQAP